MDNGLIDYDTFVKAFSSELGIADRVTFVDFGNTGQMVGRSLGVVLVNSTVGIMALEKEIPVYCLGHSIYNIEGLAQSWPLVTLKDFGRHPRRPTRAYLRISQCGGAVCVGGGQFLQYRRHSGGCEKFFEAVCKAAPHCRSRSALCAARSFDALDLCDLPDNASERTSFCSHESCVSKQQQKSYYG